MPASNNSILFLGDLFLDKKYNLFQSIPDTPFVFNLEYPITDNEKPIPGKICLKSEHNFIYDSFGKMPLAVCIANNHIFDYGITGFQDTVSSLQKIGIPYFGAGFKGNNWNNPVCVDIGPQKVCLFGYCDERTISGFSREEKYRPAPLDFDLIKTDIDRYRHENFKIIINIHWGIVQVPLPRPDSIHLARKLIDAGADAIIGHHSHVVQPIEVYRGKLIAYGLGNFLFPDIDIVKYDRNGNILLRMDNRFNKNSTKSLGVIYNTDVNSFDFVSFKFDGQKVVRILKKDIKALYNRYISRNKTYSESYFKKRLKLLRLKGKLERFYLKHIIRKN